MKLRARMVIEFEYEPQPDYYPQNAQDGPNMARFDADEWGCDHDGFFEMADARGAKYTITVQVLK